MFQPGPGRFKGGPVKLLLDPTVRPIRKKARLIPFAKRDGVKREIDRLVQAGYWRRIAYSDWATPLVVVDKGNDRYRLCADYSVTANLGIIPVEFPLPTAEGLYTEMAGCTVFTKCDMVGAYHQLSVDAPSSMVQAVITPWGLYAVDVLNFGISSAPSIFQAFISDLLDKCGGPKAVLLDDILLGSRDDEELSRLEHRVLSTLSTSGLKLNPDKCQFHQRELVYLGHSISGEGLKMLEDRVEALRNADSPRDQTNLRSSLGKLGF